MTLIELMVVLAIIGILAALSYPSYREYRARTQRALAKSTLLEAAQWLERQYTISNRYDQQTDGTAIMLPNDFRYIPKGSNATSASYEIRFGGATVPADNQNQSKYSLKAQNMGPMTGDRCGEFVLSHIGEKENLISNVRTPLRQNCWDR